MPDNDTVLVPLWRRGEIVAHAMIDAADVEIVSGVKWRLTMTTPTHRYAMRQVGSTHDRTRVTVFMHRVVLGLPPGRSPEVDHVNHDTLDNRRSNLSAGSHSENMQNRPGARVYWDKGRQRWRSRLWRNGKQINLGRFVTREEAEECVRAWIVEHPIERAA